MADTQPIRSIFLTKVKDGQENNTRLPRSRARVLENMVANQKSMGMESTVFMVDDIDQLLKDRSELSDRLTILARENEERMATSPLTEHAARELSLIEAEMRRDPDTNPDDLRYQLKVHEGVMDLIRLFRSQGHSGLSSNFSLALFEKLASFDNLSPLTDNPLDWIEVGPDLWQNRRNSAYFSKDGGRTAYDVGTVKRRRFAGLFKKLGLETHTYKYEKMPAHHVGEQRLG